MLLQARAEQFRARHDEWEDPEGIVPAFHYGVHYSSAAAVCSYLLRLHPFTECATALGRGEVCLLWRRRWVGVGGDCGWCADHRAGVFGG